MKNKFYKYLNKYYYIDYDIFEYGIYILLTYLLVFVVIFTISLYLNIVLEEFIFWLVFIPLRKYSGGFHFTNKFLCLVTSTLIAISIGYTAKLPIISPNISIIIIIFTFLTTIILKTSNHPNKNLSDKEIRFFTNKSLKIQIIYILLLILPNPLSIYYYNILLCSLLYTAINLIIAKISNYD